MRVQLRNPGLVLNGPDGMSCFPACVQMVMRARNGVEVPSFRAMDRISRRSEGKYTWEYALLSYLAKSGFEVSVFTRLDFTKLSKAPASYLIEFYGEEVGRDQATNSDLENLSEDIEDFLGQENARWIDAEPTQETLRSELERGCYIIPIINQRILQADAGYVSHAVVIFGVSEEGVTLHNPGPPATEASEVAWDLFNKAWEYPDKSKRMLISVK